MNIAAGRDAFLEQQTAYYRFDMVRVDDGLIQEHWDVAFPSAIQR